MITGKIICVATWFAIVGIVHSRVIDETSNHYDSDRAAITGAMIGKAVLMNPEKFANAAKTAAEAGGVAIENMGKALKVIESARNLIATTTSKNAFIINLSNTETTWYAYNSLAPVQWWTQHQSYMGAYTTVEVGTVGWGSMTLYKDNKHPAYKVSRGGVYLFDGKNLSIFIGNVQEAQNHETLDIENEWMDCWVACGKHQGSCTWCGTKGMCCTQKSGWTDTSNGCDGTFGGWERHECTLKE